MVSTRGHRDNEDESKSSLPQRECRKPRTTLQEPEDEIFWESDETVTHVKRKTRSGVTFKAEKSLNHTSGGQSMRSKRNLADSKPMSNESEDESEKASKNLRTRTFEVLLSRSLRGNRDNSWSSQRATCRSCNDASPSARIKKVVPNSHKETTQLLNKDDDMIGVEGDTDTDDDLFHHRRASKASHSLSNRRKGRRSSNSHHSSIKKEFVMNGDDEMSDKSDHEIGLRRSSRQRKSLIYSQSWIFGDKKLRGYPNMIHSSEPENDEPRPARKNRYIHSSGDKSSPSSLPQRRSLRFRKKSPEQRSMNRNRDYLLRRHGSRRLLRRSRRLPLRYRDSQSDEEDDDDDDDDEEEEEEEEEGGEEDEESKGKGRRNRKKNEERSVTLAKRRKGRPTKPKLEVQEDSRDETENSEDDDDFKRTMVCRRGRSQRGKKIRSFDERDASSETEEKEGDEEEMKEKIGAGGDELNEVSSKDKAMVLEKPKRQRKPVSRLTYEPIGRRAKVTSSDESKDDDDDGDDGDDDEEEEEEEEEEEKKENNQRKRYSLRQNRKTLTKDPYESLDEPGSHRHRKRIDKPENLNNFISSPARKQKVFNKKYRATHNSKLSSTSSSSDEKEFEKRYTKSMTKARNRCLPANFTPEDLLHSTIRERGKIGSSLADIDPMHVDTSVTFDCVGGLSHHIKSLKEMIIFPLLYPEVFQKFSITPPRGVLFYGQPGTGKTLVARALTTECSQKDRKVAFFMRKGADCLSKWVGESERQLRLLFDQAYQMRPSIIFFDEIDGLAPVRSTRQDQIHSSIVSTLLALMDGLDSRGEVVVIGATNRIDAIDPALRRPGRFDREFHFPLPSVKARKQIIDIHTRNWSPKPSTRLVHYLSEQTVGYCGADLKALCAEATLIALRSRYPQIYSSNEKLLLDVSKIHIKFCHFRQALVKIVPAGQRAASNPGRKLNKVVQPLLQPLLTFALRNLQKSFPQGFNKLLCERIVHRPRLLVSGLKGQGQTSHLAPAILHSLEKVPTHKLDLPSLFSVSARAPEEACAQVFHEARRNLPSIIYIPLIDQWWNTVSETVRATFLSLLNDFDPTTPLLLLATSETPYNQLDEDAQKLFSAYREELLVMANPKEDIRRVFFRPLFFTKITQKPKIAQRGKRVLETLPVAPPPQPRKLNPFELRKIEEIEEATLRELRIFLRQICAKLAKNRMFYIFTKPVEVDEVPDYLEVISTPMDLETMMTKIDHHQYQCAEDFLNHIDLICSNALEYNPDKNPEDKLIRHRACTLRDTAYAYIKAEMDTDFEMKCRDIRKARIYRQQSASELAPDFIKVAADALAEKNTKSNSGSSTPLNQSNSADSTLKNKSIGELNRKKKRRRSSWARGLLSTKKRRCIEKEEDKKEEEEKVNEEGEEENNEADTKSGGANELECEEDTSLHSSLRCDGEIETNEEQSTDISQNKVSAEPPLCNGSLSTEDSRDSMKVTSAADLLYNRSLQESIQRESIIDSVEAKGMKSSPSQIEAEESVGSSSEPGCSNERNTQVLIDWAHLEAVYESCISFTEGVTVDELHYLYTVLLALTQKYVSSFDRAPLLTVLEVEIRKFAEFREKKP